MVDKKLTKIRFFMEQLQVTSGFHLDSSLRVFNRDLKKSLKILEEILSQWSPKLIKKIPDLNVLIQICCYLFQNFLLRKKPYSIRKDKAIIRIETCLVRFFSSFNDVMKPSVIQVIIKYLNNTNLWHLEYISSYIFRILLSSSFNSEFILSGLVHEIELLLGAGSYQMATEVCLTLHQLLAMEKFWHDTKFVEVTPLLQMYHTTVTNEIKNRRSELCSSLELCLQGLFRVMSSGDVLEAITTMVPLALDTTSVVSTPFGNLTLEGVIQYMKIGTFSNVPTFLLEYLIESVASPESSKSQLACKIIARLFDDKKNYNEFLFPKIFHSYMSYNVTPSIPIDQNELTLILTYQKSIYQSLLLSVKQHNNNKRNLNAIYNTICTIIVKVLPGTEAATVVCLLMDIQNYFLESKVPKKIQNYGHGLVLALMSLYCWVYRGKPLLTYVDSLISKRFAEAQHLLPPSSAVQGSDMTYKHHSTSLLNNTKKNLFFDNLELRYALWKCFVTKETVIGNEISRSTKFTSDPVSTKSESQQKFVLQFVMTAID